MKLSPQWIRDFVDMPVDNRRLADDLTLAGIAVEGISGEAESTVFEMEITTNRPDAMNHYGVAREASALYDLPLKTVDPKLPPAKGEAGVQISIEEPDLCARFTGRVIRDVSVKASTQTVTQRLTLIDQRTINNAVDATNYTLWEMGKPTHVFDLDLLEGRRIIVRHARDGEKLKTLDGVERKLTSEDLVVADAVKAVGLAGTMGGFDTMITDKTRNVMIESAWWDPVTVRKMSRRHGLHTDASHRFERGADFESTVLSCDRVAQLILQSGGGELQGEIIDVIARRLDQAPITLRLGEIHRILGEDLPAHEVLRILRHLGFELLPEPGVDEFTVRVPGWRMDVEREVDLIEEVARLHGYDKFANRLPAFVGSVVDQPDAAKEEKLRATLLALGYNETISMTFISHADAEQFSSGRVIELANPLSEEASVMRSSMVPGMVSMLAYNMNRGSEDVRLFEAGNVFEATGHSTVELKRVCFGTTGSAVATGVHQPPRPYSFFDVKGDIENLLGAFEHSSLVFDGQTADYYHPGRSARGVMDGKVVAQFGQLHPEVATNRKLRQEAFVAELYLDVLYRNGLRDVRYHSLPRYPTVQRDFSFVFSDEVSFADIHGAVMSLRLSELRGLAPAEIFHGGNVPAGKYSLLLRANFQADDRTLREDEVSRWSAQIIAALQKLGGTIRAGS
ncbi:MAG TPA: phenylalanine--tRNA ligase subunit beta [Terriglobales bacterium]|jgi:phenylalanyl-tRNA synthetase beta chain